MVGIVVLIVSIVMAVWIYQVVDRHHGELPWLWATGAFVFWPLVAIIAGYKYNERAIMVVGMIGLCLILVGIVTNIAYVAFL